MSQQSTGLKGTNYFLTNHPFNLIMKLFTRLFVNLTKLIFIFCQILFGGDKR